MPGMKPRPVRARFDEKHEPITESGCWIWTAGVNEYGYGIFKYEGQSVLAHRLAFTLDVAEIPDGLCVCHSCDTPACVNPAHLFLGSHEENMHDMYRKGRGLKSSGENHHSAKLTADDVVAIRASVGELQSTLATRFGVSVSQIDRVRNGRAWK